jgi:hypothetical protein
MYTRRDALASITAAAAFWEPSERYPDPSALAIRTTLVICVETAAGKASSRPSSTSSEPVEIGIVLQMIVALALLYSFPAQALQSAPICRHP